MKELEHHPWPPYIPDGARLLIMGTFPPPRARWSFDFYYPNRTNDFWKIMGLIFLGSPTALLEADGKSYDLQKIKEVLNSNGIALNDTGRTVHRQKGNASDKYLDIIESVPLFDLLKKMPQCRNIATTGEKAAGVIASLTDTEIPKIGSFVTSASGLNIWRMPSTSRAYPLAMEKKAAFYAEMMKHIGIIH